MTATGRLGEGVRIARGALLWCAVINYAVLLVWFAVFLSGHDWLYRMHTRWFRVSPDQFDAVHYGAMAVYKLGILLLNVVPYVALRIVGRGARCARRAARLAAPTSGARGRARAHRLPSRTAGCVAAAGGRSRRADDG
jgi:hypothetical protein